MTAKAIDCVTPLSLGSAAEFKRSGVAAVGRYLGFKNFPDLRWKAISPSEVEILKQVSLHIISIWETNPTYGSYFSYPQGISDAQSAVIEAEYLGQPHGTAIYFAVDYDAQEQDYSNIIAYFKGVSQAIGQYKVGVYGGIGILDALYQSDSRPQFFYQTLAWDSSGEIATYANIYQSMIQTEVFNVWVDIDQVFSHCGWWPPSAPLKNEVKKEYVTFNGGNKSEALVVKDTTYFPEEGLNLLKIPFEKVSPHEVKIDGRVFSGELVNNILYLPWFSIGSHMKLNREPYGWDFTTKEPAQKIYFTAYFSSDADMQEAIKKVQEVKGLTDIKKGE